MPRIPDADDLGRRPTPQARQGIASVRLPPPVEDNALSAAAGVGGRFGERLARAEAVNRAEDDRLSLARADSAFLRAKIEADGSFNDDPDHATWETRYTENVTKSRDTIANTIADPRRRELFVLNTDSDIMRGRAALQARAKLRDADAGRATLTADLAADMNTALAAPDPDDRGILMQASRDKIAAAEAKFHVSKVEGEKLWREFQSGYGQSFVEKRDAETQVRMLEAPLNEKGLTGTVVDFIPPDKRQAMLDRAKAVVKRDRTVAVAEIRDLAPDHFASLAETGQGVAGLSAKAAALMDPAQLADFRAGEARAAKTFQVGQAITFAPPEDVAAQLDRLKPVPGSTRYADEARLYDSVTAHAQRMMKARIDNPAAYALREPSVARAYQAAQNDPTVLPAAIQRSLAVQEAMGLPPEARQVLPNAKGDVARIAAMKPEEAANTIEGMATQYGKYWGQAYREMVDAKLPAEYVALATLDGPGDVVTRKVLGDALNTGRTELVKALPQDKPKADIDKSVAAAMAPWERVEVSRGTVRNVATMRGAAELLAYRYAVEGRSDPAGDAVKSLIEDRYDILDAGNFGLYVPKGMGAAVEDTGRSLIDGLTADALADPGGDEKLTPAQRKATYLRQAQAGRFILNGDGTAAFLVDPLGQPVMATGGNTILLNGVPVLGFRLSGAQRTSISSGMGVSP